MANRHLKLAKGLSQFVPVSVNFSQLEEDREVMGIVDDRPTFGDPLQLDPGDDGMQMARVEDSLAYEELVVNILSNLELRESLVFVFELLRDNGYSIDHGSFAKAIHLSRRQYMRVLDDVRLKTSLFIIGSKSRTQG